MSVYQVEEYYIYINNLSLSDSQKTKIEELLSNEGYSNYRFQDNDTVLVIDDLESEDAGKYLEEPILELVEQAIKPITKTITHNDKEYKLTCEEGDTLVYKEIQKDFGLQGFDDSEGMYFMMANGEIDVTKRPHMYPRHIQNFMTYPNASSVEKAVKLDRISKAFIKACLLIDPDFEPDFSDFNQAKYEVYYIPSSKCFDYIEVTSSFTTTVSSQAKAIRVMGLLESWGVDKLINSLGDK